MPTVSCVRDDLMVALGKEYTEKEFDHLCFEFGIELDEVTSEAVMVRKEKGSAAAEKESASEELIYKIDIPANRYDLLCIEGIARALRVYLGKEAVPVYRTLTPDTLITMTVGKETAQIRPYVVAAVLRNVKFTQESYNSFIDLQVRDKPPAASKLCGHVASAAAAAPPLPPPPSISRVH
jgi:phenylalanyl-tRNA synthetase beta chain